MAATKKDGTSRPPCLHLGRVLGREAADGKCLTCSGFWVHACDLHQRCTRLVRSGSPHPACAMCPDYDPDGPGEG